MRVRDRIGDRVVIRRLGKGGMGAVYLCHAALLFMAMEFLEGETLQERLARGPEEPAGGR